MATSGKQIVDYAFRKGLLLVAIVLAVVGLYRLFGSRLAVAGRRKPDSP